MPEDQFTFGVVGGSGMLGRAIATAILDKGVVRAGDFWISNRSGTADLGVPVHVTTDNQALADACDVILLCVPPAQMADLAVDARGKLVLSVMAGVSVKALKAATGTDRVIRAMSSPAAGSGLAYSPWFASAETSETDHARASALFGACGVTDRVGDEAQIEYFTALTGPVPGFVAFFAKVMTEYAVSRGIAPDMADRAIRQLFLAAGKMMADGPLSPAGHVREMIDYAGTTAAGLEAMERMLLSDGIGEALDASVARVRSIAPG